MNPTKPKHLWITTPFLFYPAQFWPHKNHYTLIHALKLLNDADPSAPISLVLTGADKGNRNYIFRLVRELGLEQRVQMLPFIADSEILWLYDNAVALTFPSLFGPDNLPPLEAFSRRCPVVTANIPGATEQLGEAPLYYDAFNANDLAEKITLLRSSPEVRSKCIERGQERIKGNSPADYARQVFEVIHEFEQVRKLWEDV